MVLSREEKIKSALSQVNTSEVFSILENKLHGYAYNSTLVAEVLRRTVRHRRIGLTTIAVTKDFLVEMPSIL